MARPSSLTPERSERIRQALLSGAPITVAASRGGVAEKTYHRWASRGRAALEAVEWDLSEVPEADRIYGEFCQTVTRAIHDWELGRLALIQQAGQGRPYTKTRTRTWDQIVTLKDEDGNRTQQVVRLTDTTVEEGVEYDWRADAWLLERRHPDTYGRMTRMEIAAKVEVSTPLDAAIEELLGQFPVEHVGT